VTIPASTLSALMRMAGRVGSAELVHLRRRVIRAAILVGLAVFLGVFALAFLTAAGAAWLMLHVPAWQALLIVAGALAAFALVALVVLRLAPRRRIGAGRTILDEVEATASDMEPTTLVLAAAILGILTGRQGLR
jgi:hypothetical protein